MYAGGIVLNRIPICKFGIPDGISPIMGTSHPRK
jgi:hypothetical protein